MEWQPIETAPRDGTFILLVGGSTDEDFYLLDTAPECCKRPVVGMFKEQSFRDPEDGDYWAYDFWDGDWRSHYINPTHWMPLPVKGRSDRP